MIGTIIIIELYKYIIVRRYWMLEKLLPVPPSSTNMILYTMFGLRGRGGKGREIKSFPKFG